ncbi:hypothetical protein CEP53_004612 [Fusarium sp. AF-6]|nr:hypothetical protein CEP53_004612 [Fusarium sp. AF-6]
MRPIDSSELDELIQRKPILMLDLDRLTINFIDNIVRQSPGHITTKQGNKRLPLEIWLEILEWAKLWYRHALMQPQGLDDGSTNTLICFEIPEWEACGQLEDDSAVRNYQYYLDRPGDGPDDDRPFLLPQTLDNILTYKVPITALNKDDRMLYGDLTVPDVIAWAEDGECGLCGQGRYICAGCGGGRQITENFFFDWASGDCSYRLLCPLCIGLKNARKGLWQEEARHEGKEGYFTDEEYDAWVQGLFQELGY